MENSRLRGLSKAVVTRQGMAFESVIDQFKEVLDQESFNKFVVVPKVYHTTKGKQSSIFDKNHTEIAALVLSDLHFGETVQPYESNGINKFNCMVGSNRLYQIIDKFKRLVTGHQTMYKVEKLLLLFLGDMVHGSIHDEYLLTNDLLDIPSAILVARLLILAIHELKVLGIPIEINCIVGNHARTLVKMPSKKQAQTSYDWVVYMFIQQAFEGDDQVAVIVHPGQFGLVQVYGHRMIIEHGYMASMSSGTERTLESKLRSMFDSPIYRKATGMQGSSVDYIVIGHTHQAKSGERYLVNGCLTGSNEYGMSLRLEPVGAIQQMFGISRSRVPTFQYPLEVSDCISETVDNPCSLYTSTFIKTYGRT